MDNKFENEDDLWNAICCEINEVAICQHPYWVAKERRRKYFFTQFDDDMDDEIDLNEDMDNDIVIGNKTNNSMLNDEGETKHGDGSAANANGEVNGEVNEEIL